MTVNDVAVAYDTLSVRADGAVRWVNMINPPMNLLGPELVRDLVDFLHDAETDPTIRVIVFTSGRPYSSHTWT